jgi:hypothetical protein
VGLDAHLRAYAGLLKRARNLKAAFAAGEAAVGGIVEFLAGEVVARHLFKADRHFFPLFKTGTGIIETVDFLRHWLTDHIAEHDMEFARFLAEPA